MKKSRFTESQIVAILKEADSGLKVADVCRKHGISQPTYYTWKIKYGGMGVAELKRVTIPVAFRAIRYSYFRTVLEAPRMLV
jgi:putative transposase